MTKNIKKRFGLTLSLVLFVFFVLLAGMTLSALLMLILHLSGAFPLWDGLKHGQVAHGAVLRSILMMAVFSAFLGTAVAAFFSKKTLNPIRKVIKAINQVAQGDFNARVDIGGVHELEELSQSFNKMVRELSSIETLRGDFINTFSHEFKTPIVSIRGFAKLLKDGNLNESEKNEYLNIIITEAERLAALSTNVLKLSKYENIEIIPNKTIYRLDEQIRKTIVFAEPKWSEKKINVNVKLNSVNINANEDLTQQIWTNLLDNAIKFTNEGGMISISLSRQNNGIIFNIQYNGIGMNDETKAHIFDKFYQGDVSRADVGNGLGLAIVKRIIKLCDGKIEVESELGKGSKFSLWFSG